MKKSMVILSLALISIVASVPIPQSQNGQELLTGQDTRYYGFPFFWFGRPVNDDDDDDYTGNGGQYQSSSHQRSSTISYAEVGGGWGR